MIIWSSFYGEREREIRGGVHRGTHKGVNGGKIQSIGTSHYFIIRQVALLGVSDHCVKKKSMPCPHEYIYLKSYGLD